MNTLTYLLIFFAKVLENALGTLRLIVVANGKKQIGAILQFIISIIWIVSTGIVVANVKDPLNVFFFAFGSYIGSLVGSIIEEKMALGNNVLMVITNEDVGNNMAKELRKRKFAVTTLKGKGKISFRKVLMIMIARKKRQEVVKIVKKYDNDSMIIAENALAINGGFTHKK